MGYSETQTMIEPPFHVRAIRAVAKEAEVPEAVIIGPSRRREAVHARWAIMVAMRERLSCGRPTTFNMIGRRFSDRDPTTVLYGLDQATYLARRDAGFAALVEIARTA